jgi:hypothetical protein
VLAEVASDRNSPPMARVSVARALMRLDAGGIVADDNGGVDSLTQKAIRSKKAANGG